LLEQLEITAVNVVSSWMMVEDGRSRSVLREDTERGKKMNLK